MNKNILPYISKSGGLFLLLMLFYSLATAQEKGNSLKWLSFEQLEDSMKVSPKKVLVEVHTSWCAYCKMLDKRTLTDSEVVKYVNQHYYCVKLDAEDRNKIQFAEHTYSFEPSGTNTGLHSLATHLAKKEGMLVYPTLVFLDENYQILHQQQGFIKAKSLHNLLIYFAENVYLAPK